MPVGHRLVMIEPMSTDQVLVLAILGIAAALFASNKLRVDLVALLVLLALAFTGLCTTAQLGDGFGSTVVIMVGSLFVVGEALSRTGVAAWIGDQIARLGRGHEGRTRVVVVAAVGVLGSVMSSTAVVALFLPVVLRIAEDQRWAPGRLLLPLAYGALVSGMLTLVGTAPNLVVHAELRNQGHEGFGFFAFTPIGGGVLLLLIAVFAIGSRWLLPAGVPLKALRIRPKMRELWGQFVPEPDLKRLRIGSESELVGVSPREFDIGKRFGVRIVGIERAAGRGSRRGMILEPKPDVLFHVGDVLTVIGSAERLQTFATECVLDAAPDPLGLSELDHDIGIAVVMIHPESSLIGKTLAQASFRTRYHLHVAGVRRDGEPRHDFAHDPLRASDALLVMGPWSRINQLRDEHLDLVLLTVPAELAAVAPARRRMPIALLVVAAMVIGSASGLVPVVTSSLAAAVAMVLGRCITLADAYRSIHWGSLVLIAGMLPLAGALERTGVLALVVDGVGGVATDAGPRVLLAALFVTTTAIGCFVSNTATAVLMAPVALGFADAMDVRPQAMAMTVAIAASSAYLTPMGSPVVTLVFEPGGYRPIDLLRAGLPMFVLTMLVCVVLVPWLFPF